MNDTQYTLLGLYRNDAGRFEPWILFSSDEIAPVEAALDSHKGEFDRLKIVESDTAGGGKAVEIEAEALRAEYYHINKCAGSTR
jgi:hypothetical protein